MEAMLTDLAEAIETLRALKDLLKSKECPPQLKPARFILRPLANLALETSRTLYRTLQRLTHLPGGTTS